TAVNAAGQSAMSAEASATPPAPPAPQPGFPLPKSVFVTAADAGGGPDVKILNADGSFRAGFFAYAMSFTGGVRVAVGDVNGDGRAEIITGAGAGGGANVTVYQFNNGQAQVLQSYFAFDMSFAGGIFVGAGDVNGDCKADVIAGNGPIT